MDETKKVTLVRRQLEAGANMPRGTKVYHTATIPAAIALLLTKCDPEGY